MQANIAIGLIETSSIAKGVEASDAMCKMASVRLVKAQVIARGKYVIFISGPVGEVESSMRAGREIAQKTVVDEVLIRNVHSQVLEALDKRLPVERLEAVGIIETKDAIAAVLAADASAKAASVRLIEVRNHCRRGQGLCRDDRRGWGRALRGRGRHFRDFFRAPGIPRGDSPGGCAAFGHGRQMKMTTSSSER